MTINELIKKIEAAKPRGAWSKGVKFYALWMLENVEDYTRPADSLTLGELVNHCGYVRVKIGMFSAQGWNAAKETSEGGCFHIYSCQIAQQLCNPSELRSCQRKDGSYRNPNSRESWLDVQTRAVYQALLLIQRTAATEV